jgi:NAD(P)-dependent dehydrogenase (short-subunit alcohol dehydrogenase family)
MSKDEPLLTFIKTPSPSEIHPSLRDIHSLITQPQWPMPGVPPHTCQLSAIILVPSPNYATGPVATIPPSAWADTINTRLLSPILTTQIFLPLLTLRNTNSTILVLYPSISSSLSAPFAGPEVTTARALSGFATSLRTELRLLQHKNIDVVELKLGNIDLGPQFRGAQSHVTGTEVLAWSAQQRSLYGPQYLSSIEQRPVASAGPSTVRGSPARALHWAVMDALEPASKDIFGRKVAKKRVIYAGRGARSYSIIGEWVPAGLVGWMMGLRGGHPTASDSASNSSSETGWEKVNDAR